jgi:hypothetical protein
LDSDRLAEFLGEEQIKKLRKRDVEKLKNPAPASSAAKKPAQKAEETPPTDPAEFVDWIRKKHGLK